MLAKNKSHVFFSPHRSVNIFFNVIHVFHMNVLKHLLIILGHIPFKISNFDWNACFCLLVEKELARVQAEFVSRVPSQILTQLIEALVTDHFLSESEKESILKEDPSGERIRITAEKACCLFDTVKNKGDKACEKMIRHLQTKDPALSSLLHLYSDPSGHQGKATYLCNNGFFAHFVSYVGVKSKNSI